MQNVTNCFIANLALADIVIGLFAIPFQVNDFKLTFWICIESKYREWDLNMGILMRTNIKAMLQKSILDFVKVHVKEHRNLNFDSTCSNYFTSFGSNKEFLSQRPRKQVLDFQRNDLTIKL